MAYVPYLTNMEVAEDGSVLSADIKLDYVVAKNIYPTAWENSRITEVIFAFPKTYKRKKYVQLQHHKLEPWQDKDGNDLGYQYVIENSVVECSSGAGRDLTPAEWNAIPYFEGLAARVETGSNQPQFIIDKLNIANNVDEDDTNPMGVALFANSIDVLAKIDLEYDSYANEFTLGRKRIFVAPEMLTDANGSQVFDPDDSVFYTLPEDYFKNTKEALHEVNMELRTEQHEQAINNDLNLLSFKCGFGTQYYRFERGTVATATQVISENSDMYRTIRKHEIILQDVLTDLIRTIIRLGKTANVSGLAENTDIVIDFDDSIIEDKQTERAEDRKDVAMGAMGLPEYRAKWYGETEEVAASKLPDQSAGVLKCGFGTQYYRFERGTVATATQVISENSDMYRTIRKHEIILQDVLTDLIRTIIRLGKTANVSGLAENTDIVIDFDDSIIEDKQTERAEDRKDVAMGAMGLPEYRAKWYGETEEVAASKLPDQSAGVLM